MANDDQIRVSELPEAQSQQGLWVLGVDSQDRSVKFQAALLKGEDGRSAVRAKTTYAAGENTQTGLAWDTVHVWPSVASLTFTLASMPQDNEEHQVVLVFDTPADVTSFALNYDSNILWGANIDLSQRIEASTRYEVIISASSMIAVYTKAALPSNS